MCQEAQFRNSKANISNLEANFEKRKNNFFPYESISKKNCFGRQASQVLNGIMDALISKFQSVFQIYIVYLL